MRKALFSGILSLALASAACAADEPIVHVVQKGSAGVIIVPAELPKGSETLNAALEIAHYVGKITGQRLPVLADGKGLYERVGRNWQVVPFEKVETPPSGKPEIHVGWTSRALKEVDKAGVDKLDIDGFLIRTTPEAIFLVGPEDWSTAYACFTFLEELCGVRWYLPGEFGEDVPRQPSLSVPLIDKTYEPAYKHRQYSGFNWRDRNELRQWGMHRKVRARLRYHHNLGRVFDVKKYGEKYPELYPIIGGKRRIPGPGTVSGWQPCLTHPKAVEIAVEYAKEAFAKTPDLSSISLGVNDGGRYCECPRCMELVDESAEREGRRSVWFFRFANAVAERFDELFPDKLIGYLLYGECKQFPEGMKIHPRLIGFYVYPSFQLITPEGKQKFDEGLAGLSKFVSRFALYDWFYGDGLCIPRMQIRQAKYWLEHGYKMGARHVKAEAYMNWGLDGFKYWMHTKLMWNPTLSVDDMMEEFFTRFFKESAEPMRDYFRIVEEYTVKPIIQPYETRDGVEMRPVNFRFRRPEQLESFPPEAVKACEPLLDKAEQMAQSYLVWERVRYFRAGFEVARMMTLRYHLAKEAPAFLEKAETLSEGMAMLARALDNDLDVEQYYKWVLRDDPFCVRYPPETMFGGVTLARSTAAARLSRQIVSALQQYGDKPIDQGKLQAVTNRTLAQAFSEIADSDARSAVETAVAPFARKIILCNEAPAPRVDGRLDDPCWTNAIVYSDFVDLGTGKPAEHRTEVRLVHDGERLYVAFRCEQDTSDLLAWTKERDDRLWREDGVEFLLNRPTDTSKEQNFQVILNTTGNIYDFYEGSADWDGDIQVGVHIEPEFYTIELSIALRPIGIDPAKQRFVKINLVRNVYGRKELRTGRPTEISTWYLTHFGNLDPQARGWLVFN